MAATLSFERKMTEATENADILERAKKRFQYAKDSWSEVYLKAKEDQEFMGDQMFAQWDEREAFGRASIGRPVFQIDQLTQFIHQVENDIRMNTPTIKTIPVSEGADIETAEALQGAIKAIEYKSNADVAYDTAASFAIKSSFGFITVDHDYANDADFIQELKIERVVNPLSVLIDPDSITSDGSDAKYGFIAISYTVEEFQKLYPDADAVSFTDKSPRRDLKLTDSITCVIYYEIEEDYEEMGMLDDGSTEEAIKGKKYKHTRKIAKRKVMRYKLAGNDVLEEARFPGKYIPIVPVYGEESWVDGKRGLFSLIRKAKDSQKLYNLSRSIEAEILFKQQQAPVQAAVGQMEGFEEDWKNPDKAMVLYYKQTDVDGNPAPAPQRLQPPTISSGYTNFSQMAENNIRQTLGMYNATAGKREGNASGVALRQLEQSSDVGNYHFSDNLVRSITQVGKILVCAIPEIMDSPRFVQMIDKEEKSKTIGINGKRAKEQDRDYYFTKDETYDVRVVTGPSFTTQRQEAGAAYNQIIQAMPDLMPVIGDLVFENQDTVGSQAIAARMKKFIDPKFLDEKEKDGMQDAQAQEVDRIVSELQAQIGQLTAELQNKQADTQLKMAEIQVKSKEAEIKEAEIRLKLFQAQKPEAEQVDDSFDKALKAKEVEIKAYDAETKRIAALQKSPEAQMGIKLDTSGFQVMKTPEQLELEQRELGVLAEKQAYEAQKDAYEAEKEERERMDKIAQTEALIVGINSVQQTLGALVQAVSQPIEVVRDEQGNLIGAR
jgi:hypothetical protein